MTAIIFVLMIIIFILYFFAAGLSVSDLEAAADNKWLIYAQIAAFTATSFGMYALFERKKGWPLGLKQHGGALWAVHGLLTGAILMTISSVLIWVLGGIDWQWVGFNRAVLRSLLDGLILFTCVAIYEEILARGYIQGLVKYHYGIISAIVVSSILFAVMHGFNPGTFDSPFPIINLLLAGILLSLSRELSGGLWMPIGLHLTWNYFQGHVYGFSVSGTDPVPSLLDATSAGPALLSGGSFGVEGSFISTVVTVIGIIAVYFIYRKKDARQDRFFLSK